MATLSEIKDELEHNDSSGGNIVVINPIKIKKQKTKRMCCVYVTLIDQCSPFARTIFALHR